MRRGITGRDRAANAILSSVTRPYRLGFGANWRHATTPVAVHRTARAASVKEDRRTYSRVYRGRPLNWIRHPIVKSAPTYEWNSPTDPRILSFECDAEVPRRRYKMRVTLRQVLGVCRAAMATAIVVGFATVSAAQDYRYGMVTQYMDGSIGSKMNELGAGYIRAGNRTGCSWSW